MSNNPKSKIFCASSSILIFEILIPNYKLLFEEGRTNHTDINRFMRDTICDIADSFEVNILTGDSKKNYSVKADSIRDSMALENSEGQFYFSDRTLASFIFIFLAFNTNNKKVQKNTKQNVPIEFQPTYDISLLKKLLSSISYDKDKEYKGVENIRKRFCKQINSIIGLIEDFKYPISYFLLDEEWKWGVFQENNPKPESGRINEEKDVEKIIELDNSINNNVIGTAVSTGKIDFNSKKNISENILKQENTSSKKESLIPEIVDKSELDINRLEKIENEKRTLEAERIQEYEQKVNTKKIAREKFEAKKKRIVYLIFVILIILASGIIISNYIESQNKKAIALQKQIEKNKVIAESREIKKSRITYLSEIYKEIIKELKEDFNEDGIRNLSTGLIARISSVSENLEPYRFVKNDSLIIKPLSPERADLFTTLIKSKIDKESLSQIFSKSNFTYCDFNEVDLSNINLAKELYGIAGSYNTEAQILVTPVQRINMSHSNFNNANLDNTILYGDFSHCSFKSIMVNNLKIIWSNVERSNFQGSNFQDCLFENSSFNHCNFTNIKTTSEGFINCDLRACNFDDSDICGGSSGTFKFKNCFFSSNGLFFKYEVTSDFNSINLVGYPFIDERNDINNNPYEILTYDFNKSDLPKNNQLSFANNFHIINKSNYKKKQFVILIDSFIGNPQNRNILYSYIIRTNDNINRFAKRLYYRDEFNGHNFDKIILDTQYIKGSLNKLESIYHGVTRIHKLIKDSLIDGVASFRNCKFYWVDFIDNSLEFVSFENAVFHKKDNMIRNKFISCKLFKNDFRIKSGYFCFLKNASYNSPFINYDSLFINNELPVLVYKNKIGSLNNESYKIHLKEKKAFEENPNGSNMYFNSFLNERTKILEWVKDFEDNYELDSTNKEKMIIYKK
jgi:uncharacterized protein YjbI with pentapeptide repeats